MSKQLVAVGMVVLMIGGAALAQSLAFPPAQLKPLVDPAYNQKLQPFAGEVRFVGSPGYARVCSVMVNLTCRVPLDSVEHFQLAREKPYMIDVEPDSCRWEAPIDSGSNFSAIFTFTPNEVGTYTLILKRKNGASWQALAAVVLAIDEDGNTLYAGSALSHRQTTVPPHPKRDADSLILHFPLKAETGDARYDRHFTARFKFSPPPAVNETTYVEFHLQCQIDLYRRVQFILDYSTMLVPSDLPESWGDWVASKEEYRDYNGSFSFVPRMAGLGILTFKVVGRRPLMRHTERSTTDFPMYYLIGENGEFQFIGTFNPWERFGRADNPMLGTLNTLLDLKREKFAFKQVFSKPDYIAEERKAAKDSLDQKDQ
ncbi:MAG: hypothetical protein KAT58_01480 [candidate division Zixibacteria bacterium]|nr:hypothetical protein [candidate division Zixibacteria bacterium]